MVFKDIVRQVCGLSRILMPRVTLSLSGCAGPVQSGRSSRACSTTDAEADPGQGLLRVEQTSGATLGYICHIIYTHRIR